MASQAIAQAAASRVERANASKEAKRDFREARGARRGQAFGREPGTPGNRGPRTFIQNYRTEKQ